MYQVIWDAEMYELFSTDISNDLPTNKKAKTSTNDDWFNNIDF